ncbi:MAG: hypothetical protein IT209_09895, partial [Armatimonadetes bacterium]|nr:hypothetical protein [Armatimonadota bacterium]
MINDEERQDTFEAQISEAAEHIGTSIESAREQTEVTGADEAAVGYEDGFTMKTVIGALFIGFIMMPGAMYMGLVAGQGLGPAAQWVTIVLFAEVARRSFKPLQRAEIYTLFYVAGGIAGAGGGAPGLSGGPFGGFVWWQYFVQSPQTQHVASQIPTWVVPHAGSPALIHRTFLDTAWLIPIGLLLMGEVLGRLNWIGGGYVLFRLTSDIERLPFPMAPIAAAGATALSEAGSKEESWRWQVFSVGTVIGLLFGSLYLFIPVVTGVMFSKPLMLLPIPFLDLTLNTEKLLPATPVSLVLDLGVVLTGFVIPFPIVVGSFIGAAVFQLFGNPILHSLGLLPTWKEGMSFITTSLSNTLDFWLSAGIGIGFAVGLIGLASVIHSAIKNKSKETKDRDRRILAT